MELRDVADATMGSVTAGTLRVLSGTERALTVRQVARLSGASQTGTAHVLARLERAGLVHIEEAAGASLCTLNREHVATALLIEFVNMRGNIFEAVRGEIRKWRPAPVHASVYGSFARGDETIDSDIDVLIVLPQGATEESWSGRLHESATRLRGTTGHGISWFPVTMAELRRGRKAEEPIMKEWLSSSRLLLGKSLKVLLADKQAS